MGSVLGLARVMPVGFGRLPYPSQRHMCCLHHLPIKNTRMPVKIGRIIGGKKGTLALFHQAAFHLGVAPQVVGQALGHNVSLA